jgi:hypothetical protein
MESQKVRVTAFGSPLSASVGLSLRSLHKEEDQDSRINSRLKQLINFDLKKNQNTTRVT